MKAKLRISNLIHRPDYNIYEIKMLHHFYFLMVENVILDAAEI